MDNILREILKREHISINAIGRRLGFSGSGRMVYNRFRSGNLKLSTLKQVCDELGYEIVVRKDGEEIKL